MGVSWNEFWGMNPCILRAISKGHEARIREQDSQLWMAGKYIKCAMIDASSVFSKKKTEPVYPKEPELTRVYREMNMTEEERLEKEMRKAIAAEEAWILSGKSKGLAPTII